MKMYITFGYSHVHSIAGKTLDKDSVAVIECKDYDDGREKAFELFGNKFCMAHQMMSQETLDKYYPRGLIEV